MINAMALFSFKIQLGTSKPIKGILETSSLKNLVKAFKDQGFHIIFIRETFWLYSRYYAFKKFLLSKVPIRINTKIIFCSEMATLLKAGLNTNDAVLQCISTSFSRVFTPILLEVYQGLQKGEALHEACSKFPNAFSPVFLNFLKQTQQTGNMEIAFQQYEKLCSYQKAISHGVITQIMPQVFFAIALMFLIYFLHQETHLNFKIILGPDMPFWTKVFVEQMGWFFSYRIIFLVLGLLTVVEVFKHLMRKTGLVLWVPFFNKTALLKTRINFIKIFAVGIESKLPVQSCFLIAKESIQHKAFKKWAEAAEASLFAGLDFTTVLMKTRLVTSMQKSLIASSGGQAENLEKSFNAMLEFLEKEVETHNVIVVQLWKLFIMIFTFTMASITFLAYLFPLLGWVKG